MKPHISEYIEFFGYSTADFISCEICSGKAVDIHHIHRRGKGGDPALDRIENLMALCRVCHIKYGDKVQFKALLYKIHLKALELANKEFDRAWITAQLEKYS